MEKKGQDKLLELLKSSKVSGSLVNNSKLDLAQPKAARPIRRDKEGIPVKKTLDVSDLDSDVIEATKNVASLAGPTKQKRTETALLKKLKSIAKDSAAAKVENEVSGEEATENPSTLSSLFSDMKIEKEQASAKPKYQTDTSTDHYSGSKGKKRDIKAEGNLSMADAAFLQKRARLRRQQRQGQIPAPDLVDLQSGSPLGIFSGPTEQPADSGAVATWRACQARELSVISVPAPRNAIEEMVLWTKQGKLWHFPVDNEQGLDYTNDPFYNHVFLEHHLESWCPRAGPIRHFMETVCLGLSKNPYVTSEKKVETIKWFQEYFERPENNEILVHSGFWEASNEESLSA